MKTNREIRSVLLGAVLAMLSLSQAKAAPTNPAPPFTDGNGHVALTAPTNPAPPFTDGNGHLALTAPTNPAPPFTDGNGHLS